VEDMECVGRSLGGFVGDSRPILARSRRDACYTLSSNIPIEFAMFNTRRAFIQWAEA
jgi:hypothetical protein